MIQLGRSPVKNTPVSVVPGVGLVVNGDGDGVAGITLGSWGIWKRQPT